MKTLLTLLLFFTCSCLAGDLTTLDGKTYRNITVTRVEADGLVVTHAEGACKIDFLNLPEDVRKKYSYDPAKAEAAKKAVASAAKAAGGSWQEMDQRMIFLTVQLSSVEASLAALNRALISLGIQQVTRQSNASIARQANEAMDRNAGGPVPWADFYGHTAEKFFYHPVDPHTYYHTWTILGLPSSGKVASGQRVPSSQGLPVHQRPPQFDYIYRANADAERRAQAEVARLGNNAGIILERRRQLEAEQSALWCKIAFHAVAGRELLTKPLYYYDLKSTGPDSADGRQRLEALRAAMGYLRDGNRLAAMAEQGVDADAARCYSQLQSGVDAARGGMERRLMAQPVVVGDMTDSRTMLGKFVAVAKRMSEVSANIADAQRLALDGDRAGDQGRKLTFRSQLQQSLMLCAEALLAGDECVNELARDWKVQPDTLTPAPALSPLATLAVPPARPAETPAVQRVEAASFVREISPKNERGLSLGSMKAGTVLRLQFVSGKWKAWGIAPTACPDDAMDHGGDNVGGERNRLAIINAPVGGAIEVLTVVPPVTAVRPFEFTAPRDLENVALRINGGTGDWSKNPDGHVKYLITVLGQTPIVVAPPPVLPSTQPWTNSVGMKFAPVAGTSVLFSIWDTRVQDYQAFVTATGRLWMNNAKNQFDQGPTHPALWVAWEDAQAFCRWLTDKERREGTITSAQEYRLPTDLEWSAAVGLENETGRTAMERSGKVPDVYPWGTQWPPPYRSGNFGPKLNVDDFEKTSPVGSFAANRFGLYDMGGNVCQWCEDFSTGQSERVLRGSTWSTIEQNQLLSSYRRPGRPVGHVSWAGFRCVLAGLDGSASR